MLELLQGKQDRTVPSVVCGGNGWQEDIHPKSRDNGAGDGRLWSGLIQGTQGQILREISLCSCRAWEFCLGIKGGFIPEE